ncbi:MAG: integration host factor subunit alpha [Deltaproteobacteria bacterium]|nr:integration host factor subunit alpha [Deltaproteobacteria bacterium]
MAITKKELLDMACDNIGIPKKDCAKLIESAFEIIKAELEKGNDVKISGFGKWTVKSKKQRRGRNPRTGEDLTICARSVVTFKPSVSLKNQLNK